MRFERLPEAEAARWLARARAKAPAPVLIALDRLEAAQGAIVTGSAVAAVVDAARAAEFIGAENRDNDETRRGLGAIDKAIAGARHAFVPPALRAQLLEVQEAVRAHNRRVAARPRQPAGRPRRERAALIGMLGGLALPKRGAERLVSHLFKLQ